MGRTLQVLAGRSLGRLVVVVFVLVGLVPLLGGIALLIAQDRSNSATETGRLARDRAVAGATDLSGAFDSWRTELLTAAQNAAFRQWYSDPSARPRLRAEINAALVQLHGLYPDLIDEACFIDAAGQEQGRATKGIPAGVPDLSPDEKGNAFFPATFALPPGAVYQASPYLSPDSHRWVISNSTPLQLAGRSVALLHFETNLDGLRARLAAELSAGQAGRVVDTGTGKVLVDTTRPDGLGDGPLPDVAGTALPLGWVTASAPVTSDARNDNHWQVQVAVQPKAAVARSMVTRLAILVLVMVGLLVAAAIRFASWLTRPLQRVVLLARALATGDLTVRTGLDRPDEIGQMAAALDTAADALADAFGQLDTRAGTLNEAAVELSELSAAMAESAEQAAAQSSQAAKGAGGVADSVGIVAGGVQEMGAATAEIAHATARLSQVTADATSAAAHASTVVAQLGESSTGVETIAQTITSIASQTNLLALNATIEAARAGEAGKGFAVVAGEVKQLAQQTAAATQDIHHRINAIQADAVGATTAIGQIIAVIEQVNELQLTVASAADQQAATTAEIDRNAGQAASGAGTITISIQQAADATSDTTRGAQRSGLAATELAALAEQLQQLLAGFRYGTG